MIVFVQMLKVDYMYLLLLEFVKMSVRMLVYCYNSELTILPLMVYGCILVERISSRPMFNEKDLEVNNFAESDY